MDENMILKKRKGSIAIVGSRGIPNNYGGFECFTENISQLLTKKGRSVYVSCEHPDNQELVEDFNGVKLFYFPIKHPESSVWGMMYEVLYDMYSLYWASRRVDQIYMLGYSAALFFFIPKLFGKKLYLNPDGFEWKRNKFNGIMKFMLKINERLGTFWADQIVADSKRIKEYFDSKYGIESSYIAYGASEIPKITWDLNKLPDKIKDCNINENEYWLVVARLEPENNIHKMVEGYLKSNTKKPLILIGNYISKEYAESISKILENKPEDKQVIFVGGIYNQENLNMLRQNCYCYIHGHLLEVPILH